MAIIQWTFLGTKWTANGYNCPLKPPNNGYDVEIVGMPFEYRIAGATADHHPTTADCSQLYSLLLLLLARARDDGQWLVGRIGEFLPDGQTTRYGDDIGPQRVLTTERRRSCRECSLQYSAKVVAIDSDASSPPNANGRMDNGGDAMVLPRLAGHRVHGVNR